MDIKHHRKIDTYKPKRLRLIGLSLRASKYDIVMLKRLLVIVIIASLTIGIVMRVRRQLLNNDPELLNSLKKIGLILGLAEPSPETPLSQQSSSVQLGEAELHLLDPIARFYMEADDNSGKDQTKSNRPWLLQGLADEVLKDPENKKAIKHWVNSLNPKTSTDGTDTPPPYEP